MVRPDYKEFSHLAQESTLIPVTKSVTADLQTPVSAFLAIAGQERRTFLLESVEGGEKIGRYTFLGARPYMLVTARDRQITIERGRERGSSPAASLRCCAISWDSTVRRK